MQENKALQQVNTINCTWCDGQGHRRESDGRAVCRFCDGTGREMCVETPKELGVALRLQWQRHITYRHNFRSMIGAGDAPWAQAKRASDREWYQIFTVGGKEWRKHIYERYQESLEDK